MATLPLLSATDLTRIQTAIAPQHVDTCSIVRLTRVAGVSGGQRETWVAIATNAPCRIAAYLGRRGGQEDTVQNLLEGVVYWRVFMGANQDVRITDRITSGSRTFEVKGVNVPGSLGVETVAYCLERT